MSQSTLIIGIGNRFRGDDALGLLVAEAIQKEAPSAVKVIEHSGESASLIEAWQGYERVILIDAVRSGCQEGTLHFIDLTAQALPDHFHFHSTHAFGVAEAVELARVLGKLPASIVFYGVEGKSFGYQESLSVNFRKAVGELSREILATI